MFKMPTTRVTFASTNRNKFLEVQAILAPFGITVDFGNISLVELQSDSLEQIAREKAKSAFEQLGGPVFVEDDGLFIKALKNFPGQYSSFVFKTIGNEGILRLIEGVADRSAYFSSLIAYHDGTGVSVSEGKVEGRISDTPSEGGWGYDPIFVPSGSSLTFAELKEEKNRFSHRRRALEKFADQLLVGS
jgi:XTP/dITP diphosphohydrolase